MKKSDKIFGIISILFTILTTIAFIILMVLLVDFFMKKPLADTNTEDVNTAGISLAFLFVFYLIVGIGELVVSLVTVIFSIFARKWNKIVGNITIITNVVYILIGLIGFILMFIGI